MKCTVFMASKRHERQQEVFFRVMRLLQKDANITTREIAQIVGISNGSAYYCVEALVDKGFIKLKNFTKSQNKAGYLYELTPRGIREKAILTIKFLDRKRDEYNDLKREISNLEHELGLNNQEAKEKSGRVS